MNKRFFKNLIPSVLAFTLAGIYVIVDGLFVGNACGDVGLSAINIAWPVVCILQSLGTGIGTGGAVLYNIHRSSGRADLAEKYLRTTFTLLLVASVIVIGIMLLKLDSILGLLGASGETYELGMIYARIMIIGGMFQLVATGLVPLIRNNGGATFAMIIMVVGFGFNIVGDWLLVWKFGLGVAGAAYATIAGQLLTAIGGMGYLLYKKLPFYKLKLSASQTARILRLGLSSFGLSICPSISLMLMNRYFAVIGGYEALAAYAVISYVISISYAVLQGVAEGTQPLISESYSKEDAVALKFYRNRTYLAGELLALVSVLILYFSRAALGPIFGTSGNAAYLVETRIWIALVGMFFLCFVKIATAGFYATERALAASLMAYAEPVFVWIVLLIFPRFMGIDGVFLGESLGQVLNALLGVGLIVVNKKK